MIMTASVTVLIPPAVEPGDPPMNIRRIKINLLDGDSAAISMVLKPAVLAVTLYYLKSTAHEARADGP